jgi:hypothetical protein
MSPDLNNSFRFSADEETVSLITASVVKNLKRREIKHKTEEKLRKRISEVFAVE